MTRLNESPTSLRVDMVAIAEPLEFDFGTARPFRCGMLARALETAGHSITWWTSSFDHVRKEHRYRQSTTVAVSERYKIRFLYGPPYRRNISLARVRHNRAVAAALRSEVAADPPDLDVLFVCVPTHDLAAVALEFGQNHRIPVVLDIRDQWPDIYLSVLPGVAHPFARFLLGRAYREARNNLRSATCLTAVSESYLEQAIRIAGRSRTNRDRVFPIGFPDLDNDVAAARSSPPPLRVVFLGTFGSSFALDTVIDAARELDEVEPGAYHITVAGDGDRREALERRASGLSNCELPGWLDAHAARQLLQRSHVGLAAYAKSATQTLPNKPFEYWAAGLPIISSLRGDLEELITSKQVGWTYEADDVKSLVCALRAAASNPPILESMSFRSRALFQSTFAASKVYPRLVEYLEHVAQSA